MSQLRFYAAIAGSFVVLGLIVTVFVLSSKIEVRTIERDQARADRDAHRNAHALTILNYRNASAAAQQAAQRNVERVAAEQAAITKGKVDAYEKRLADVDARLVRARAQIAARTDLRSTSLAPVSIASAATCEAYGGGDCDALLAKLAIAEKQAWNLTELRDWVREQASVSTNGGISDAKTHP